MDYHFDYNNNHKPINYKRISLFFVIGFIIYANHNLIIFPNFSSEISFDGFIVCSFVVLLAVMLLTDTFKKMVLNNSEAIVLSRDNADTATLTIEIKNQQAKLQQLLTTLEGQVEPKIINHFIANFYWLDVNKTGVEQVKAYLATGNNNNVLALLNQAGRHNQLIIKANHQQLIVIQKALYKKATPVTYNASRIKKEECFMIRQVFKIKKNQFGEIVKFADKITVKKVLRFVF